MNWQGVMERLWEVVVSIRYGRFNVRLNSLSCTEKLKVTVTNVLVLSRLSLQRAYIRANGISLPAVVRGSAYTLHDLKVYLGQMAKFQNKAS